MIAGNVKKKPQVVNIMPELFRSPKPRTRLIALKQISQIALAASNVRHVPPINVVNQKSARVRPTIIATRMI